MRYDEVKRRTVAYLVLAALGGMMWWAVSAGAPLHRQVTATRTQRSALESTTRQVREHMVRTGGAGIEDSIAAARLRYESLAELVPQVGEGESDADVRRLVTAMADGSGVAVRSAEELPADRQGALLVSSVRFSAEGRYHDVGRWLASVGATRRLIESRGVTLVAVGDTSAAGEASTRVRFEGVFRWFQQDSATVTTDSTKESK